MFRIIIWWHSAIPPKNFRIGTYLGRVLCTCGIVSLVRDQNDKARNMALSLVSIE